MIDTRHLLEFVAAWVTNVNAICFGGVALISGGRSWFMHYALHMNVSMGENIITLATFVSGLVIWNVMGVLGAWLFAFLYNESGANNRYRSKMANVLRRWLRCWTNEVAA